MFHDVKQSINQEALVILNVNIPNNMKQKSVELITIFFLLYIFLFFIFYTVVDFVIHWDETAMGLHVFPIPIHPPTSLSTLSP